MKQKLKNGSTSSELGFYDVWTDGSSVRRTDVRHKAFYGGAAYVILHGGKIYKQANYGQADTTISRMELLAIVCGVGRCPAGADVRVFSDSQYAIGVLSGKRRAYANLDLIDMFHNHSTHVKSISFFWCKGHSGNKMNEMVDRLANEGRKRIMQKTGMR